MGTTAIIVAVGVVMYVTTIDYS